jgi:osmotically-inducible protein OsmY
MADALEGSNIDVDIKRGAVTLNGTVATEAARAKAVEIAKGTDGVKDVTNNLTVARGESAIDPQKIREAGRNVGRIVTDGWVKSTIYARYLAEKSLEDSDIKCRRQEGRRDAQRHGPDGSRPGACRRSGEIDAGREVRQRHDENR